MVFWIDGSLDEWMACWMDGWPVGWTACWIDDRIDRLYWWLMASFGSLDANINKWVFFADWLGGRMAGMTSS